MSGNDKNSRGENRELMRTKALLSLAFLLSVLFLASCTQSGGTRSVEVNYYTGSQGLTIAFADGAVNEEVYENSTFGVNMIIENKGAFDIIGENQAFLSINYDPFYISRVDGEQNNANKNLEFDESGIRLKGLQLAGKSKYFPKGDDLFISLTNLKAKSVEGQRLQPDTQLFISLCYPYTTTLSKLVCVDFNTYGENLKKQVCMQKDLSLADQGAPLAITKVEVDNQPISDSLVRPIFIVHVSNRGRGSVLSQAKSPADLERVCSSRQMERDDFNKVSVEAFLSENIRLVCQPETIRLVNDEGITRCSVSDEDAEKILAYRQNYEAPLTINLSYIYLNTISKVMIINKLDPYGYTRSADKQGCQDYEVESNGKCITRCEYCAEHPTSSECQAAGKEINFQPGFACKCGESSCSTLYADKGLCAPGLNLCPGMSYCCLKDCTSSQFRGSDGKCYNKCSQCTELKNECACGTDMGEGGQVQIFPVVGASSERFCCPKEKNLHSTKEECEAACSQSTAP